VAAVCSECATVNVDTAKFCVECGTPVAIPACPNCGTPATGGRFCAECGTPLAAVADTQTAKPAAPAPPVAERRLASVLFGDLVGFTPLSESRDPEEVRELLSRYFEASRTVVQRYGGTIEKFIGDAVMAVWGVPTSHEDDAERSVRAGLDLVDRVAGLAEEVGIPGLALRVGVVTGEVAVTIGAEGQGMVAGDIVNTAARVQAAAEPGAVWVDETTRNLTAAAVAYADAGEHLLKGKSAPVTLHRARTVVAAVGGAQRVDGLEAPFTGRERELRFVKELFEATVEDGRSRLALISGVAGTGKSRIGWEFEKYVDGLTIRARWHRGRCLSYGEGVAFWALAEMVRGRLGLSEGDDESAVTAKLAEWLDNFVTDAQQRRWLQPLLAVLLGTETGSFLREDMFAGWTTFFEILAASSDSVVLLVEDLQYADDGFLDFLEHALQTARCPLFVLGLSRPDLSERRPSFGIGRRATTIQLEPLSDRAMESLVDGLVDGLPDSARQVLIERAEGIPLYAVETVRALIDRDAVIPRHGRYVLAEDAAERVDLGSLGAPASLQALVSSRLDALEPAERSVVQDAAVLGMSFSAGALAALGSTTEEALQAVLVPLVRKEIFEMQTDPRSPERGQYRFVQAVVRQVAYETLSRRDRKARHLAVAQFLSTEPDPGDDLAAVIAQHYLDAVSASASDDSDGQVLAEQAQSLLERAAQRSLSLGSSAEAYRHYVWALDLPASEERRARLQEGAARAALATGDAANAVEQAMSATRIHDAAGRPVDAARAATVAGTAMWLLQDLAGSIRELTPRYEALANEPGAEIVVLELTQTLGVAHNYLGELDTARRYIESTLLIAEALGDKERILTAMTHWSNIWIVGGLPTAGLAVLRRAVELARELQQPTALVRPLVNTAAFHGPRDLTIATEAALEAYRLAQQTGNAPMAGIALANALDYLWSAGRWSEAKDLLATSLPEEADPSMVASFRAVARWIAEATGEDIDELPDDVLALEGSDDLQARAWGLSAVAAGMLRADQQAQRAAMAYEAAKTAHDWSRTDDDFVYHWTVCIESAVAAGDTELVQTALAIVEQMPRGLVTPYVRAELLRLRGLAGLESGDPAAVEADLRAAIDALDSFGVPFRRAQAQLTLSRLLVAHGRGDEAAETIRQARETFELLGARPWIARAEAAAELAGAAQ
jgi:class 3 adenylate cyclase/tetratricopeptide (TPR) repeat protein